MYSEKPERCRIRSAARGTFQKEMHKSLKLNHSWACLRGIVVGVSAFGAEDSGFESRQGVRMCLFLCMHCI
jgi:hypothetical protein